MENDFLRVIFHISLTASIIIALLLLVMPLLHKRYPSQWRYYVWLIIAIRLLIPFSITLPETVVNIPVPEIVMPVTVPLIYLQDGRLASSLPSDEKPEATLPVDEELPINPSSAEMVIPSASPLLSQETIEQTATLSLAKLLGGIWLSGIIILFLIHAFVYIKFLRKLHYHPRQETSQSIKEALWKAGKELRITRLPEIRVCSAILSPILTGVFRPVLLLPYDNYSERELLFILRHELVHFRRRDLLYKLILTAAKLVHWFNPLVWLMAAQANKEIELSCDDLVMTGLSGDDRIFYGDTILNTLPIKSKWGLEPVFTTSFGSTKNNMKHRLQNLFDRSLKKKGIVAFLTILLLTGLISGLVVSTPTIAAGSEPNAPSSNTSFSNNDNGASRIMLGPYTLKKDESCTVTITWNEGGTQTLQLIKETLVGKESAALTEHTIINRIPLTVTAWEDGNYRLVIPAGKSMTDIVCTVDYEKTNKISNTATGKSYVSFDEVELRTYDDNVSPYVHDILSNYTSIDIVAYERGMLAFDEDGKPLKIKWLPSDNEMIPAYYFLFDWGKEDIRSGATRDVFGGWSLNGGNPYHPNPAPEVVWQIEYVLYNFKSITFNDGTVWVNPNYESWRETYEGKKTDVNVLNGYYPYEMEIRPADIKTGGSNVGTASSWGENTSALDTNMLSNEEQKPLQNTTVRANAYDGTWAAASSIEGKTWQEQIDFQIKWLADTYGENKSGFVITEALPKQEASNISRINYMYNKSNVFYEMSQMRNGIYVVEDGQFFSRTGFAFTTDEIYRTVVMVDSDSNLYLDINHNLTEGKMGVWLVDPDGIIVYQGGLNSTYKGSRMVSGKKGLWSVIRICQGNEDGFMSGNVAISLRQSEISETLSVPTTDLVGNATVPSIKNEQPYFQIVSNNGKNVIHSGSFIAQAGQRLTITAESSIKGGTVDLFLFSPSNKEQRFTFDGSDQTATIELTAGTWAYNCTGFYESGSIVITGVFKNTSTASNQSFKQDTKDYDNEAIRRMNNSGTWGDYMNQLLPNMSAGAVETVVDIYLARHLFANVTTPEAARQVSATIAPALAFMSKEDRESVEKRIAAYY